MCPQQPPIVIVVVVIDGYVTAPPYLYEGGGEEEEERSSKDDHIINQRMCVVCDTVWEFCSLPERGGEVQYVLIFFLVSLPLTVRRLRYLLSPPTSSKT